MKKRVILTSFFATYYFFVPFVWLACTSVDEQYVIGDDEPTAAESLEECQSSEFLTADCVEILAEEEERVQEEQASILAADTALDDLEDCYTFEQAEDTSDDDEETETTNACEDTVNAILAGFETCVALEDQNKYFECSTIEDAVNDTADLCDTSSSEVTDDFCSLFNETA